MSGWSASSRKPEAVHPTRPIATCCCRRRRRPPRSRSWRSSITTSCAAVTVRPSVRWTPSTSFISRAGASPIPWPSGCWSRGFSGRSWTGFRSPRFERRSIRNWPRGLSSVTQQRVASTSELPKESMKRVEVDGEPICLIHAEDDKFYAIGDTCTHEEYSLCEGELWEMSVECPRHGSRFDVRTGQVTGLPAVIPAKTYPVTVQNGDVYLEVGD
ncbi:MAG: non-heme iron oxygenase ferredoxin subunit [Chloroflexi bacterium]|nr:MAG: non-heme iron oxygenase ferredoxin subunit [Chloroflexota bacterium]